MDQIFDTFLVPEPFRKPILIALWFLVIWVVIRLTRLRIGKSKLDHESQYRAKKAAGFVGYAILIIVVTMVYRNSLGGLTVALGVAGAGIAFALQEVITSIAGWLALLMGNFYKTGDRVQLGGIKGDVIDIGVIRTTLMETGSWVDGDLYNGRIVRIANSFVFKEPVFNYSADFPFLWDEIKIPIRYGSNYQLARKLIEDTALTILGDYAKKAANTWSVMTKKYMIEHAKTDPMITMVFNDNWVEFTLRYVVNFKRRRATKDLLFSTLLDEVSKVSEKVQLASATFDVTGLPEVKVSVSH